MQSEVKIEMEEIERKQDEMKVRHDQPRTQGFISSGDKILGTRLRHDCLYLFFADLYGDQYHWHQ